MIRVLAMSPSGETFFTRDANGVVWQHRRLSGLSALKVGETAVSWAITEHGYDRIDEDVENWPAVEALVEGRIRRIETNLVVNPEIARRMLPVLDRWNLSPTDRPLVSRLVSRLLADDAVAGDSELRGALLDRLGTTGGSPEPASISLLPGRQDHTRSDRAQRAFNYYYEPRAA